jgi:cellulose synthase/poly-beta-1,6-N-acetylglucosamine synthase-like glycosyltransferase
VSLLADMARDIALSVNVTLIGYLAVLNVIYTVLMLLGLQTIGSYVKRRPLLDYETIARSELTLPISVLVPAYNEAPVIVESVKALLGVRYPHVEVVVVNDGSLDGTLDVLREAFALVKVERVPRSSLESAPVRDVYMCSFDERLIVLDKANGGKADSINAGLRYARYPLFCTIDADTMVDDDAFVRLVAPFQRNPETVACGGIVRIVNGSTVRRSRVVDVRMPGRLLLDIQVVEYLRAFLTGRTGWSRVGALLIISGAFGVFRRDVVVAAGGYDPTTIGEDAELVVRLHRYCRDRGIPYRVVFLADPVCWTEAPASLRVLCRQRARWHRGLIETLFRHRGMVGRPRYGVVGLFALPYFLVFEAVGPLIEVIGLAAVVPSLIFGAIDAWMALLLLGLSLTYGLVLSFGALLAEGHAFRRYRRWSDLRRMMFASIVENFGYRQLCSLVRAWAWISVLRKRRHGWGEMTRAGYTKASSSSTRL